MMNQEQFLKALQERIAMLEQAEQQDILAEYAQHIEMQIKEGLSEEEAIRDFGSLDELAAEILEAYHIDPAYQASAQEHENPEKIVDSVQKPHVWEQFSTRWHRLSQKAKGWFHREPKPKKERVSRPARKQWNYSRVGQSVGRFWTQLWRLLKQVCKAVLWLFWNGVLLICAVPLVLLLLCGVIGFGLLLVLLAQGYPLIGVALMTIGGLMCCVAVLYLGRGLIWHRGAPTVYRQALEQEPVTEMVEQIHQTVCTEEHPEHDEEGEEEDA